MQPGTHITHFELERWTAGELSSAAIRAAEGHVATCPACAQRLQALRTDLRAFEQEVPYASFRIEHEARVAQGQRRARPWRLWLPTLTATAAMAGAVVMLTRAPDGAAPSESNGRLKGDGMSLSLLVESGGRLQGATSGEVVQSGAQLQLAYDAGSASYMAVLGVDETGEVSLYFPEAVLTPETHLAPLPAGAAGVLPFSLTLDTTPGAERFIAVFARDAETLQPVLAALTAELRPRPGQESSDLVRSNTPLVLPREYSQSSVWVTRP